MGAVPRFGLIVAALLLLVVPLAARAAEDGPPTRPIARIETGMHAAMINRMARLGDGRIVTVSDDRTARLWAAADGRPLGVLRVPIGDEDEGALYAVAAQGSRVAVAGRTGAAWEGGRYFVYLFDVARDGERMVGRLGPLPGAVMALAFSRDGRHLAAGMQGQGGVAQFDFADKQIAVDKDFRDTVQWLEFSAAGELAAASAEGVVKLYPAGARLQTPRLVTLPGLSPWSVAFSPDGRRLAVGGREGGRAQILATDTLAVTAALTGASGRSGGFPVVAWAPDGATVYGAGTYADSAGRWYARAWGADGRGGRDIALGPRTVTDLIPAAEGLFYATTEPAWGLVGPAGPLHTHGPAALDLRGTTLRASSDGGTIQFTTADGATMRFGLKGGGLARAGGAALPAPATAPAALGLADWQGSARPALGGRPLDPPLDPGDVARAAAFGPDGVWALGSDFHIRLQRGATLARRIVAPAATRGLVISGDGRWLIGAFADGTIRWYTLRDGSLALSLFVHADRRRWIVWTPGGQFDHSPADPRAEAAEGAEALVGFHLNRGRKAEAEFVAVGQMYATFFRRDVVRETWRAGGPVALAATAPKAAAAPGAPASPIAPPVVGDVVGKGLPPRVKLVELCWHDPARNAEECRPADLVATRGAASGARTLSVPSREVVLRLITEDRGGGIDDTVVRRNGAVVPTTRAITPKSGERSEEHRLLLERGANLIDVSAFAKAAHIEAKAEDRVGLNVTFAPVGAAADADKDVVLRIVAVGVDRYPALPEGMQLANSAHDARGLVRMMQSSAGRIYSRVEAQTLVDDKATRRAVLAAIDSVAEATRARPQDMVLIFFAGHGFAVGPTYYFVPPDVKPPGGKLASQADIETMLRAGGLDQGELMAHIGKLQTARALILLDTCHSGALMNTAFANPTEQAEKSQNMGQTLAQSVGRAVIAAADQDEEAMDGADSAGGAQPLAPVAATRFAPTDEASPDSPHGLFTRFILMGLAGAADFSKDGVVTMGELAAYVQEVVPAQAAVMGHQQRPSVSYQSRGPFSLRYVTVN